MNKNSEKKVFTFKELIPIPDNANILAVMRDINNTLNEQEDSKSLFDAITNLRQFNKYNSYLFSEIFNLIYTKFLYIFSSSSDHEISLNSIYLVKEIFSNFEEYIQDWIKDLIQIVLSKAFSDDDLLVKEQAVLALQNVADKMHFQESIDILIEYIYLDEGYSEICFQLLYALIKKFDQILLENLENWDSTFMELTEMYMSDIKKHVNYAKEIMICIYEKIGKSRFGEFINASNINDETLAFIEMIIGDIFPEESINLSQKIISFSNYSNSKFKSANLS